MKKGNGAIRMFLSTLGKVKRGMHYCFVEPVVRRSFGLCGESVRISAGCTFAGNENIQVGNNVSFGSDMRVLTTRAKLKIGNFVMFAPGVMIVTGDHRTDIIGKYMHQVTDADKRPEDDKDVVIEDDVWVGANATILKGVTIGRGSVVASGAVVTKSCPPYSVVAGVPARVIKCRFTPEQIAQHEKALSKK